MNLFVKKYQVVAAKMVHHRSAAVKVIIIVLSFYAMS